MFYGTDKAFLLLYATLKNAMSSLNNGKVNLSPRLIGHHTMKMAVRVDILLHALFISVLARCK
jgi:hypothetical protein